MVEWRRSSRGARAPVVRHGWHRGGPTRPSRACWQRRPGRHRRQQCTAVEATGGETRRAWGGSRNTKVRPIGTEEACRWRNDDDHGV